MKTVKALTNITSIDYNDEEYTHANEGDILYVLEEYEDGQLEVSYINPETEVGAMKTSFNIFAGEYTLASDI